MERHIGEVIQTALPHQPLSAKKVLEHFSHIELTEDELDEAILEAKRKKERRLESEEKEARAQQNRKYLTQSQWDTDQTEGFMRYRAGQLFEGKFSFEGQASIYFKLFCYYFSQDEQFIALAQNMGVPNPSLDKGLYLGGNFGVGKTWLMRLFQRNQRQVYTVQNSKAIADMFERDGDESMKQFIESPSLPNNDASNFYHKVMGFCIDDMGTEDIKNHYGNKKNVIGDLIELRYARNQTGQLLHITTNLTGQQMSDFYGGRVASRLRECMNIIDFIGSDLRR